MQEYIGKKLSQKSINNNESGSTFKDCTFSGKIEEINFSFAVFEGCKGGAFNACNFTGAINPPADGTCNYGPKEIKLPEPDPDMPAIIIEPVEIPTRDKFLKEREAHKKEMDSMMEEMERSREKPAKVKKTK